MFMSLWKKQNEFHVCQLHCDSHFKPVCFGKKRQIGQDYPHVWHCHWHIRSFSGNPDSLCRKNLQAFILAGRDSGALCLTTTSNNVEAISATNEAGDALCGSLFICPTQTLSAVPINDLCARTEAVKMQISVVRCHQRTTSKVITMIHRHIKRRLCEKARSRRNLVVPKKRRRQITSNDINSLLNATAIELSCW